MPLPTDFNTVTVYGTYCGVDGAAVAGAVTFTAGTRLRSAATKTSIIPGTVTASLNQLGTFTVELPATDDPDIAPAGWVWLVEERFGGYSRSYSMLAPLGTPIDLTNAAPVAAPGAVVQLVTTVAGHGPDVTGNIALVKADVGLSAVDNTTDAAKPVSTATAAALAVKAPTARTITTGTGLTGGGDLSADRTLAVSYGTTAGTAAQGSDPRFAAAFPLTTGESTSSRSYVTTGANALTSGTVALQYFTATKTETITQVRAYTSGTAAAATPTLCRYGVYAEAVGTGDLTLIAATANDTALWAATSTGYARTLTAAWSKIAGTRYAVGLLIVTGAAAPTFMASAGVGTLAGTIMAQAPRIYGASPAGQTDLPASLTTAQVAASIRAAYVEVLP